MGIGTPRKGFNVLVYNQQKRDRETGAFSVKYRLAPEDIARADGEPFDTRVDAIDHRDWFFGHSPGVISCWVENKVGKRTGAILRRKQS